MDCLNRNKDSGLLCELPKGHEGNHKAFVDCGEDETEWPAEPPKPVIKGPVNGNVFYIIGVTRQALRRAGLHDRFMDFDRRVAIITAGIDDGNTRVSSYNRILALCQEFVEFEL